MLPRAIAIVGPTASGKTALAIKLAKEFGGEIVSADSRQLYRGTSICTDIPAGKWRRFGGGRRAYMVEGVPHYLMNCDTPAKPITLAQYRRRAIMRLNEIASRGRLPILVGGTGLYVRAVVENYAVPEVAPNPKIRARLEKMTSDKLLARLRRLDPEYAERISPNNRRYLVRALEVIEATGKPFSKLQGRGKPLFRWLQIGVLRSRPETYRHINRRVDKMVEAGLLKETERLARRYGWGSRVMTSLGYSQLRAYFDGRRSLERALEAMKRDTRHYAKRQITWLRRDKKVLWIYSEAQARRLLRKFLAGKD